jgi:S-adenosylmethionine hydrolase
MEITNEFKNPSQLFIAFFNSFNIPMCIVDEFGNILMNDMAEELKKSGFEIDNYLKKIKNNSSGTIQFKGKKYNLEKKDINHGTNSCVCTLKLEDDTIARLTESSKKLKKVLSAL